MVHSGYEASAVRDTLARPLAAARVALSGVHTSGPMAPELALDGQRPAQYVHTRHVAIKLEEIRGRRARRDAAPNANPG
jgi:hypothetical protein